MGKRIKYPTPVATATRLCGGPPPDQMTEEDRYVWAVLRSLESAEAIGAVPRDRETLTEEEKIIWDRVQSISASRKSKPTRAV